MKEIYALKENFEQLLEQEASKYQKFVKDGIVDYEAFIRQPLKILWVLKETNDPDGSCQDLREFLRTPATYYSGWKRTWLPVLQVSCGLLSECDGNGTDGFDALNSKLKANRYDDLSVFHKIAIINLNKFNGGKSSSPKILKERYKQFKDFTIAQVKLIDPDVIICCGVFWVMWNEVKHFGTDDGEAGYSRISLIESPNKAAGKIKAHLNSRRVFIETFHPNQRALTHKQYYEAIITGVNMWLNQNKAAA